MSEKLLAVTTCLAAFPVLLIGGFVTFMMFEIGHLGVGVGFSLLCLAVMLAITALVLRVFSKKNDGKIYQLGNECRRAFFQFHIKEAGMLYKEQFRMNFEGNTPSANMNSAAMGFVITGLLLVVMFQFLAL